MLSGTQPIDDLPQFHICNYSVYEWHRVEHRRSVGVAQVQILTIIIRTHTCIGSAVNDI